eukprot:6482020-Amphidinium_carterae.1
MHDGHFDTAACYEWQVWTVRLAPAVSMLAPEGWCWGVWLPWLGSVHLCVSQRSADEAHSSQHVVMGSRPGLAMKVGGSMKLSGPNGNASGNSFLRRLVQTVSVA